jgi:hypothetical protein
MNSAPRRSYRKKLITNGLVYINNEEQEVFVVNISMTGMLVQLSREIYSSDSDSTFNDSLVSSTIDFYFPQLRLAGTADISRVNKDDRHVTLALKFNDISYNIDNLLYKRRVYRKNMSVPGRILLNEEYYDFYTVNVSVEGLMVRLTKTVAILEGMTTTFEFKDLSLKGEVQVAWIDFDIDGNTLIGLKYINMNTDEIKGIPKFFNSHD